MAIDASKPIHPKRRWTGCLLAGAVGFITFVAILAFFLVSTGIYKPVFHIVESRVEGMIASLTPPDPAKEEEARFDQTYIKANNLMSDGEYAAAIPYWDLVVEHSPGGNSYAYRAICYYHLSKSQRSLDEFESNLAHALADIDQAIALDTEAGIFQGPHYNLRALIYAGLASEQRDTHHRYMALAAENMRAAVSLMTESPIAYREVPSYLFASGQCEAGMRELERIKAFEGVSAPPKSSLLNLEANGYLCLGRLEDALQKNSQALAMNKDLVWSQAIILFDMDRYDEALSLLNQLITGDPYYSGDRYFLRAAIYQAQGERERALEDLETGSANTWGQLGMKDYVLGQIALEDGDTQQAIERLQSAMLTLPWFYDHPLMGRIEQQLAQLGAQAPTPAPGPQIAATPLSADLTTKDLVGPAPVTGLNENGLPLPPFSIPVSIADGVQPVVPEISAKWGEAHRMPTYLFSPAQPVQVGKVKSLVVVAEAADDGEPTFQIFLWDQISGEWAMFVPQWGANPVAHPERYVDHQGQLYLVTRMLDKAGLADRLWVALTVITGDGQELILEKAR